MAEAANPESMLNRNQMVMGHDLNILRRMAYEAFCTAGVKVQFFELDKDSSDFYSDPNNTWKAPIDLCISLDENPKVKILKDLGWFQEDEEVKPLLAYFPMYVDWEGKKLLNIPTNSLVRISYFGMQDPAEFRITDRRLDSVYGIYWVCKMVPERFELIETNLHDGRFYLQHNTDIDDTNLYPSGIGNRECPHEEIRPDQPYGSDQVAQGKEGKYEDYGSLIMGGD